MKKIGQIIFIAIFFSVFMNSPLLANQTEHIVKSGDSLWSIATQHGVTVDDLMTINHLNSDRLNIGDHIILRPVAEPAPVQSGPLPADEIYIVQAGDCLGSIAAQTGMKVDELRRINSLPSDLIRVGQQLSVFQKPIPLPPVVPSAPQDTTEYIVQPGDCLRSIADQHSMSMVQLMTMNSLNNDIIYPGEHLVVLPASSRSASPLAGQMLVNTAARYLGTPYAWGGTGPSGFDCSGFAKFVYSECGYSLPRTASSQYQQGVEVSRSNLAPGDLVFFACGGYNIDHVGIFVGNNTFIHSSSPRSGGVIYTSMDESYYLRSYVGARRVIR